MIKEKKIAYIAGNALEDCSGGVSGVNYNCFNALQKKVNARYIHVALPPVLRGEEYCSKLQKALHLPRKYFAYSPKRLDRITDALGNALQGISADMLFFSGFTPWSRYVPQLPYVAYNDICFSTYVDFYNNRNEFSKRDLQRIMDREIEWLGNARCVFFRSRWGMEMAKKAYHLDGKNFFAVSRGGAISIPAADTYQGKHSLLFISKEFIPKGGLICFELFRKLHEHHPELTLEIIGDKPTPEILDFDGVHYHGMLHKNIPEELERFSNIMSQAMFLVHPTSKDTNPLVISEAGYFGCPSVSVRRFAIPELICDGEDGFLFDVPVDVNMAVQTLERVLQDEQVYRKMRFNARKKHTQLHNWDNIIDTMISFMFPEQNQQ